jgi:ATP-dependent HslUV protease ATP-binding subunit HslU
MNETRTRTRTERAETTPRGDDEGRYWTPRAFVAELDRYIVGQDAAKRAVAVAIRNRWRRQQLPEDFRDEVLPKNILMIGSTGVGKTEIARRVARVLEAPFVRVEASNFTEVGYVGRDVESIVRDLVEASIHQMHQKRLDAVRDQAETSAMQRLADLLVEQRENRRATSDRPPEEADPETRRKQEASARRRASRQRKRMLDLLNREEIDDETVELEIDIEVETFSPQMGLLSAGDEDELQEALNGIVDGFVSRRRSRRVKVREARAILAQQEAHRLIDFDSIIETAIERAEQHGVIFIDEIDKTISPDGDYGPDVSGEGVQRDLLPIVEGSVVLTRYGAVKTDHMLFIAAGAFHGVRPSDLIPEFQGRFPVRVELANLTEDDLYAILTEPENALTRQYTELLRTEGVEIEFTEGGLREIASCAYLLNSRTEDIGARRLHTLVERVLEDVSFDAPECAGQAVVIDADLVRERVGDIALDEDASKFIL